MSGLGQAGADPALRLLEEALDGRPHLHGEEPGLTDFLVLPFVADLAARGLLAAAELPRTTRYLGQASQRPSFQATRPP